MKTVEAKSGEIEMCRKIATENSRINIMQTTFKFINIKSTSNEKSKMLIN